MSACAWGPRGLGGSAEGAPAGPGTAPPSGFQQHTRTRTHTHIAGAPGQSPAFPSSWRGRVLCLGPSLHTCFPSPFSHPPFLHCGGHVRPQGDPGPSPPPPVSGPYRSLNCRSQGLGWHVPAAVLRCLLGAPPPLPPPFCVLPSRVPSVPHTAGEPSLRLSSHGTGTVEQEHVCVLVPTTQVGLPHPSWLLVPGKHLATFVPIGSWACSQPRPESHARLWLPGCFGSGFSQTFIPAVAVAFVCPT